MHLFIIKELKQWRAESAKCYVDYDYSLKMWIKITQEQANVLFWQGLHYHCLNYAYSLDFKICIISKCRNTKAIMCNNPFYLIKKSQQADSRANILWTAIPAQSPE